jgi:hypothetical protein
MDLIPEVQTLLGYAAEVMALAIIAFLVAGFFGGIISWVAGWFRSWRVF